MKREKFPELRADQRMQEALMSRAATALHNSPPHLVSVVHGKSHTSSSLKVKYCVFDGLSTIFRSKADLQFALPWDNKICSLILQRTSGGSFNLTSVHGVVQREKDGIPDRHKRVCQ